MGIDFFVGFQWVLILQINSLNPVKNFQISRDSVLWFRVHSVPLLYIVHISVSMTERDRQVRKREQMGIFSIFVQRQVPLSKKTKKKKKMELFARKRGTYPLLNFQSLDGLLGIDSSIFLILVDANS